MSSDSEPSTSTKNGNHDETSSTLYANVASANEDQKLHPIEIKVSNMVCNFSIPLHIDLRKIVLGTRNVEYDKGRGLLVKLKREAGSRDAEQFMRVEIYNSGKVCIRGCKNEESCRRSARSVGRMVQRCMQKLDSKVRLRNYRVTNMMASCQFPFNIKIEDVPKKYKQASCELELASGLIWKNDEPKATLRIHTTGSVTILGATSSKDVVQVIEQVFPLIEEFKLEPVSHVKNRRPTPTQQQRPVQNFAYQQRPVSGFIQQRPIQGFIPQQRYIQSPSPRIQILNPLSRPHPQNPASHVQITRFGTLQTQGTMRQFQIKRPGTADDPDQDSEAKRPRTIIIQKPGISRNGIVQVPASNLRSVPATISTVSRNGFVQVPAGTSRNGFVQVPASTSRNVTSTISHHSRNTAATTHSISDLNEQDDEDLDAWYDDNLC